MTKYAGILSLLLTFLISLSCSLNYGKSESMEESVPEFTFKNARYTKVENSQTKTKIEAEKIEQYKSDGTSYASQSQFSTYDSQGQIDTEGTCGLLAADTQAEIYTLLNDIQLELHSEDTRISAQALQYNGKNEQIISSRDDEVTIHRKDTTFTGKGFSASGVSHSFSFLSGVSGTIQTKDDNPQDSENQENVGNEMDENSLNNKDETGGNE